MVLMPQQSLSGSPPHTRERRFVAVAEMVINRITPAYAGKTLLLHQLKAMSQDHPRIRGKDTFHSADSSSPVGSPPHTRERRREAWKMGHCRGITPAYAGKTFFSTYQYASWQDHPRIRGKDFTTVPPSWNSPGSPPHTRERPDTR